MRKYASKIAIALEIFEINFLLKKNGVSLEVVSDHQNKLEIVINL
jgi:hypothetical protein